MSPKNRCVGGERLVRESMPQMQLPIFPAGVTEINSRVAVEAKDGQVCYVYGRLPVFQHEETDGAIIWITGSVRTALRLASRFAVACCAHSNFAHPDTADWTANRIPSKPDTPEQTQNTEPFRVLRPSVGSPAQFWCNWER